MKFRNPNNGYTEAVGWQCVFWALLFNWVYLIYRRAYFWGVVWLVAAFVTFGVSWLVLPFFGRPILRGVYYRSGWETVKQ